MCDMAEENKRDRAIEKIGVTLLSNSLEIKKLKKQSQKERDLLKDSQITIDRLLNGKDYDDYYDNACEFLAKLKQYLNE